VRKYFSKKHDKYKVLNKYKVSILLSHIKAIWQTGVVVHICNPSTWEIEIGGCRVQGQVRLCYIAKTLSPKINKQ
jgi:hypothetical protein